MYSLRMRVLGILINGSLIVQVALKRTPDDAFDLYSPLKNLC